MVFHFLPEVTDVLSRFVPRIISFYLLLLAAGGTANAQSTFEQKAANPFDNNNDGLPDLGMAPENHDGEKHFAEIGGEGQDSVKQLTLEEQLAQTADKMTKKA